MLVPVLLAALASCKKTPQKVVIEVKATPATLSFGAVGNEAQTVAVTANDEWEYSASETWVTASKVDGETLSVTVEDNVATAAREAKVTLYAKSDANARAEVLIQQSGAGELTFNVTPASMTFVGEGAEPQVITVEASEGLVWEAAPAADVTWIQVAAEGNQISVTVKDNPNTTERSGRVIVSSPIGEKAVLVTQQGKVMPMIYDVDPASLEFRWDDMMMMGISFKTSAEVTDWSAHVEDANGNQTVDWLFINANKDAALPLVEVMPILFNETSEDRTAYIVLTPQGVEDPVAVRVPVVQKGKPTYNSTLTDNVEVALSHAYVTLYPNGTTDLFSFSRWNLTLWGEGVNYDSEFGMWSGTGNAMQLQLQAVAQGVAVGDEQGHFHEQHVHVPLLVAQVLLRAVDFRLFQLGLCAFGAEVEAGLQVKSGPERHVDHGPHVPSGLVLHVGYALAFHCLCNDGCRLSFHCLRLFKCRVDLIKIISIDIDHMEIKCFKFLVDRIWRINFCDRAVNLQIIVIHDHYKVVQFLMSSKHGSLPYLTFLDLTVSEQCVYSVVCIVKLSCDCHTYSC